VQALTIAAFYCAMAAVFVPVLEKIYDAVVLQVSRCVRGEFSPKAFCFAFVALVLSIPSVLGISGSVLEETDEFASMVDEANSAVETQADQTLMRSNTAAIDVFAIASNLASDMFWINNPMPTHHQAAVTIQKRWRAAAISQNTKGSGASRGRQSVQGVAIMALRSNRAKIQSSTDGAKDRPGILWLQQEVERGIKELDADEPPGDFDGRFKSSATSHSKPPANRRGMLNIGHWPNVGSSLLTMVKAFINIDIEPVEPAGSSVDPVGAIDFVSSEPDGHAGPADFVASEPDGHAGPADFVASEPVGAADFELPAGYGWAADFGLEPADFGVWPDPAQVEPSRVPTLQYEPEVADLKRRLGVWPG